MKPTPKLCLEVSSPFGCEPVLGVVKGFRQGLLHHSLGLLLDRLEHGVRKISFAEARDDAHGRLAGILVPLAHLDRGVDNGPGRHSDRNSRHPKIAARLHCAIGVDGNDLVDELQLHFMELKENINGQFDRMSSAKAKYIVELDEAIVNIASAQEELAKEQDEFIKLEAEYRYGIKICRKKIE